LPGDYAAGHALGATYSLDALPDEQTLRSNLQTIARAYRALTYRGGIDADPEGQTDVVGEFALPPDAPIIEIRRYAYHRRVERNRAATQSAKKIHGTAIPNENERIIQMEIAETPT
jgi:5-methylcytosine-specific restriction protein A